MDQSKYNECVKPVYIKASRQQEAEEKLTKDEQTQYLSLLGKISWLAQITRPDLKYDVYQYARHNKNPTVQNLMDLNPLEWCCFKSAQSTLKHVFSKT